MSTDESGNVKVVLDCGEVRVFSSGEWERASFGQPLKDVLSDIGEEICCECGK